MHWQRSVDAALKTYGLTHTQYLVLVSADICERAAGDAVTQRAIASAAGLDEATTSQVVRKLTMRGLLDRGPTFEDQRAWRVCVTASGRRSLRSAAPHIEGVQKRFLAEQLAPEWANSLGPATGRPHSD
jgi:DNA-binding MarR family transcriptional regulator